MMLLDIYNKLLGGNQSCVDLLSRINLSKSNYSNEAICNILLQMASGALGQCNYGDDTSCQDYCDDKCDIAESYECHQLNYC